MTQKQEIEELKRKVEALQAQLVQLTATSTLTNDIPVSETDRFFSRLSKNPVLMTLVCVGFGALLGAIIPTATAWLIRSVWC